VIVVTCSACLLPQALFVRAVWDDAAGPAISVLLASLAIALFAGRHLPEGFFVVRPFERGRLYRRLGVRAFKRFVPDGDLISRLARPRRDRALRAHFNRAEPSALEARGRVAERAHLVSLIAVLPLAALAAVLDRPGFAAALLVLNLIFHEYPVLLQRYTRARLQGIAAHSNHAGNE
jgi:glycosyl-4,4'-diaponeurosporenoate acyltransferase